MSKRTPAAPAALNRCPIQLIPRPKFYLTAVFKWDLVYKTWHCLWPWCRCCKYPLLIVFKVWIPGPGPALPSGGDGCTFEIIIKMWSCVRLTGRANFFNFESFLDFWDFPSSAVDVLFDWHPLFFIFVFLCHFMSLIDWVSNFADGEVRTGDICCGTGSDHSAKHCPRAWHQWSR